MDATGAVANLREARENVVRILEEARGKEPLYVEPDEHPVTEEITPPEGIVSSAKEVVNARNEGLLTRENPIRVAGQDFYQDENGAWKAAYRTIEGEDKPQEDYPVTHSPLLKTLTEIAEKRGARLQEPGSDQSRVHPDEATWFHGTPMGEKIQKEGFKSETRDEYALYGPGYYFTDDPRIAGSYSGHMGGSIVAAHVKVKHPFEAERWYNYDEAIDIAEKVGRPDVADNYRASARFIEERKRTHPEENYGKPRMGPLYTIEGYDPGLKGGELWKDLVRGEPDIRLKHSELNSRLQKMGYDGITYDGGKIMGKTPHNVVIAFDHKQIKFKYGAEETDVSRVPITPKEQAARAMEAFREEAKRGGHDPNDPNVYDHWKNHLESLPDPGESFKQHRDRTPNVQVNRAEYEQALSKNQLMLASRLKSAALKRGVNFEPPKPVGGPQKPVPRVSESAPNELTIKSPGKSGKLSTSTVVVPPEKIPELINYHLGKGHTIIAAPKGALEAAARLKSGEPVVPAAPPRPMEEFDPATEDPTPVVDAGNGAATPPPPGTIYSPTDMPGGWSDWTKLQAGKMIDKFIEKWNDWWPATYAAVREFGDTPVIKAHQQWLKDALDYMHNFSNQQWWKDLRKMSQKDIQDWEDVAVKLYRRYRDEGMMHPEVAWEKAVTGNALENLFRHRRRMEEIEEWAAKELGVKRPKRVDDPYIARLTNREGKEIVDLGFTDKYLTAQLKHSIGTFDKPRVHATMNDGIAEQVQYDPTISAVWQRERVGSQLVATARMLKTLRDEGALYDKREEAAAASKDGRTAIKVEGIGGRDYWARSRQEARFIEQNFNKTGSRSPIAKITEMMNVHS